MRQNPQVTDGLLSQAVEGKVQELSYKTKEGITEVTRDHEAQTHGGSWLRPLLTSWKTSPPTQQSLLTFTACGGQAQSPFSLSCHCTALSPWGAESPPYPWPVPPVTLFLIKQSPAHRQVATCTQVMEEGLGKKGLSRRGRGSNRVLEGERFKTHYIHM